MKNPIPYPLRAFKFAIEFKPFGFWWKPLIHVNRGLTEFAKQQGTDLWWMRWLWFQVSIGRWV